MVLSLSALIHDSMGLSAFCIVAQAAFNQTAGPRQKCRLGAPRRQQARDRLVGDQVQAVPSSRVQFCFRELAWRAIW
jgi:hypothetical protein